MAKKPDKLWKLIHSMSKEEKRFYSMYSEVFGESMNKDSKKLFKIYSQYKTWDYPRIKEKFSIQLETKHVSKLKNKMFDQLVDVLVFIRRKAEDISQYHQASKYQIYTRAGLHSEMLEMNKRLLNSEGDSLNQVLLYRNIDRSFINIGFSGINERIEFAKQGALAIEALKCYTRISEIRAEFSSLYYQLDNLPEIEEKKLVIALADDPVFKKQLVWNDFILMISAVSVLGLIHSFYGRPDLASILYEKHLPNVLLQKEQVNRKSSYLSNMALAYIPLGEIYKIPGIINDLKNIETFRDKDKKENRFSEIYLGHLCKNFYLDLIDLELFDPKECIDFLLRNGQINETNTAIGIRHVMLHMYYNQSYSEVISLYDGLDEDGYFKSSIGKGIQVNLMLLKGFSLYHTGFLELALSILSYLKRNILKSVNREQKWYAVDTEYILRGIDCLLLPQMNQAKELKLWRWEMLSRASDHDFVSSMCLIFDWLSWVIAMEEGISIAEAKSTWIQIPKAKLKKIAKS